MGLAMWPRQLPRIGTEALTAPGWHLRGGNSFSLKPRLQPRPKRGRRAAPKCIFVPPSGEGIPGYTKPLPFRPGFGLRLPTHRPRSTD